MVTALAATSLLFGATPAGACSCMEVTIEDAMRPEAVAAFVGTAVSVKDIGYTEGHDDEYWGPLRWTFEVETVLLGEIHPASIKHKSAAADDLFRVSTNLRCVSIA